MNKIALLLSAVGLTFGSLSAVDQRNTGVDLGTMIFEDADGKIYEILAITTNGTLTNNLMGITSGTLGYEGSRGWVSTEKAQDFINGNMEALALDISKGEGETLASLEELLSIKDTQRFRSTLQRDFSKIYTSPDVTGEEVMNNIIKSLKA